jgi:hypothetical protein
MPRRLRVQPVGIPLHIIKRGNSARRANQQGERANSYFRLSAGFAHII